MAAEEGVATVLLSEFLAEVRDLLASEEQDQGVEESVSSHIQSNYGLNWYYLLLKLDAPLPEDVLDERIFDSLVTCPRIAGIVIPHTVEASCVPRMLRRALEKLPNRQLITFHPAFPLSEAEAEEIFEDILTSGANHNIFFTIRYDEGVMRASFYSVHSGMHAAEIPQLGRLESSSNWHDAYCLCFSIRGNR